MTTPEWEFFIPVITEARNSFHLDRVQATPRQILHGEIIPSDPHTITTALVMSVRALITEIEVHRNRIRELELRLEYLERLVDDPKT